MLGLNQNKIVEYINNINKLTKPKLVKDYNVLNFSEKIVKIIGSYTDKVQREIWKNNLWFVHLIISLIKNNFNYEKL